MKICPKCSQKQPDEVIICDCGHDFYSTESSSGGGGGGGGWGNIIMGAVFVVGGLSGNLVLRGTSSSGVLAFVGVGLVIWGIVKLSQ
ncbi:MAG: hypothetical protein GY797_24255 [Deltaproteobacteria bacterium]|nr:hypothetical protein [Deltaproteobacteria bacterium]